MACARPPAQRRSVTFTLPTPILIPTTHRPRELAWAALVAALCFWVFRHVPIQQGGGDARYSLLLGENLLRHRDFALERYDLPRPDYRLEDAGGHRTYGFPVGTSILSIPYLALMHLRDESVVRPDGSYDFDAEVVLEARLAALLMAVFCGLVTLTARRRLPFGWSLVVTFATAFGTQVLSTTSRALWSDTWGVLLVGLAVFLLVDGVSRERTLGPPTLVALATIEVWAYVVRPTNVLVLLGTAVYLLASLRRRCWPFLLTAAGWLALFLAYSWRHFHRLLPDYYRAGRLTFRAGPAALLGNLFSPSRGLLICVPLVVGVGILLLRYRRTVALRPLVVLALSIVGGHLAMLAGFEHWWGGHCFGARLTASLVPWIVVLAVVALDAFRAARRRGAAAVWLLALTGVLALASIGINGVGACSREAAVWNVNPDINQTPERLWSWQRPQFLAPFVDPAGPYLPLPVEGLALAGDESAQYLGRGWSGPEAGWRWTDGTHATVRFAGPPPGTSLAALELEARPYLGGGRLVSQRLIATLNGRQIAVLDLDRPPTANYGLLVPTGVITAQNTLRLDLPQAASPSDLEKTGDHRRLGVAVTALRWRRASGP